MSFKQRAILFCVSFVASIQKGRECRLKRKNDFQRVHQFCSNFCCRVGERRSNLKQDFRQYTLFCECYGEMTRNLQCSQGRYGQAYQSPFCGVRNMNFGTNFGNLLFDQKLI